MFGGAQAVPVPVSGDCCLRYKAGISWYEYFYSPLLLLGRGAEMVQRVLANLENNISGSILAFTTDDCLHRILRPIGRASGGSFIISIRRVTF